MNQKIKVGIIDDEPDGREYIELLLSEMFPELEVVLRCGSVAEGITGIERAKPDILFLDIELGDGSGFDILNGVNDPNRQLIFVTAYDEFAINAIRNDAVDYILKPIDSVEFSAAVKKAIIRLEQQKGSFHKLAGQSKISLPTFNGITRIDTSSIIYCAADGNYTHLHLANGKKVLISRILQDFEQQLSASGFFRIHHKYLINLEHLSEYIKGKGGQVVMSDGARLDVSVRRKSSFIRKINNV